MQGRGKPRWRRRMVCSSGDGLVSGIEEVREDIIDMIERYDNELHKMFNGKDALVTVKMPEELVIVMDAITCDATARSALIRAAIYYFLMHGLGLKVEKRERIVRV